MLRKIEYTVSTNKVIEYIKEQVSEEFKGRIQISQKGYITCQGESQDVLEVVYQRKEGRPCATIVITRPLKTKVEMVCSDIRPGIHYSLYLRKQGDLASLLTDIEYILSNLKREDELKEKGKERVVEMLDTCSYLNSKKGTKDIVYSYKLPKIERENRWGRYTEQPVSATVYVNLRETYVTLMNRDVFVGKYDLGNNESITKESLDERLEKIKQSATALVYYEQQMLELTTMLHEEINQHIKSE